MTKRKRPPVQVRGGRRRRLSPYKRLEQELRDTRNALMGAATSYTETLQALVDLVDYFDHPRPGWTAKDVLRLAEIRKAAVLYFL